MITIEDMNSILLKYQYSNVFHEINFSLINSYPVQYDFCNITKSGRNYTVEIVNSLWTGGYYFKSNTGEILDIASTLNNRTMSFTTSKTNFTLVIHLCGHPLALERFNFKQITWKPKTSLRKILFGDNFVDNKLYLEFFGETPQRIQVEERGSSITVTTLKVYTDENGDYVNLRKLTNFATFVLWGSESDGYKYYYYSIYNKYRDIPQITVDTAFLGCKNKLKVYFNGSATENYEAYYKGDFLKDNILDLTNESDIAYAPLTIKITDFNYYKTKMLTNVPVEIFTITTQEDLEEAISNEYATISFASGFEIEDITFDYPLKIINSNISFSNCSFNKDLTLKDCTVTLNNEDYIFNNLTLDGTTINKDETVEDAFAYIKISNQLNAYESIFSSIFIHCGENASFNEDNLTNSLIFSDNEITITNSNFTGQPISDYPNMLYLTGNYNVMNNNFELSGIFDELTFNICIIKSLANFNADRFISNNSYDVDISVDGQDYTSFLYCLVDDDTIYSKG